jgi:hypothetical protein
VRRAVFGALVALLGAAGGARGVEAQADSAVRARRVDVPVPGATLATDVYARGDGAERRPVVLVRTPYGREAYRAYGDFFARRGYVFLAQDVRGRGASSGRHVPFLTEEADGAATLDWIVGQPWSDGRVGMMGPSYSSFASMVLVARRHPALRAVVNNSGMVDLDALLFPGGALNLMVGLPWTRLFAGPRVDPNQPWDSLFAALPVANAFPGPAAALVGPYPDFHQALYDAGAVARLEGHEVAILHLTGWNDFLYRHTLSAYERSRGSRAAQALVVGPWAHDQQQQPGRSELAGEDFGASARFGADSIRAYALAWFERHLRRPSPGAGPGSPPPLPPTRIFVMGANRWEASERWPAADARRTVFYLDSDGAAQGTGRDAGAGRLGERSVRRGGQRKASRAAFDEYVYDPTSPVPTVGGANFHFFAANLGPHDQRPVERRPDVLSYTTAPFEKAATLAGPLSVTLHVSSSAPDADYTAKLVLVRPDGYARIVEDGIVRARFRRSRREPQPLTPGEVVPVHVDLGATALTIPAGARLRLEVSSGNFPKYDRNPQTGESPLTATTLRPATHRVHHGERYPSALSVWLRP